MPIAPAPNSARAPDAPPQPLDYRLAALEVLVSSVVRVPWNWSAWLKIAECLDGPEEVRLRLSGSHLRFSSKLTVPHHLAAPRTQLEATLPFLPQCYALLLFYVHATLEIHAAGDALHAVLDELEGVFGAECSVITGLRALVHYHVRGASPLLPSLPSKVVPCSLRFAASTR